MEDINNVLSIIETRIKDLECVYQEFQTSRRKRIEEQQYLKMSRVLKKHELSYLEMATIKQYKSREGKAYIEIGQ